MEYLVLEPTVFVKVNNIFALIYNSLDGTKLLYGDSDIIDIFKKMKNDINIVPLENDSLGNDKVKKIN